MNNNTGREKQAEAQIPVVRNFIEGLWELERNANSDSLLQVFSDDCSVGNVELDHPLQGTAGAARFWEEYRKTFEQLESRFSRITETEQVAVLEWTTQGKLKTGRDITYRGVSILTLEGNKIIDFMAYFDSRHFTAHL